MANVIDLSKYNLSVNKKKQAKHILELGYITGRSILTADPETLIKLYSGRGRPYISEKEGIWNNKEWFSHSEIIGIWKSSDGQENKQTTNGIIHYSPDNGVHIVPARPDLPVD